MKQPTKAELEATVKNLMAQGRYSEALMECAILDTPEAMEVGKTVFPYVTGEIQYESKLRVLGPKRAQMLPPGLIRIAQEAMRTDENGFRIGLALRLLAQAGLGDAETRQEFRKAGGFLAQKFLDGRRLRFLESAIKYYAAARAPDAAFELVRTVVARFKVECGFMPVNDALQMLEGDMRMSRDEIARAVPEVAPWLPVYERLQPTGWFDAAADGRSSEEFSPGDAVFDGFFQGFAAKSIASFEPAIAANMEAHFPRRLLLADGKTMRRVMTRLVRAHGIEAGPFIAGELARRRFGASRLEGASKRP